MKFVIYTILFITISFNQEYIGPDEMLEVTPDSIRMRKINKKRNMKN